MIENSIRIAIAGWDNCKENDIRFVIVEKDSVKEEIQDFMNTTEEDADFISCFSVAPFLLGISPSSKINTACVGMIAGQIIATLKVSGIWVYLYLPGEKTNGMLQSILACDELYCLLCCGYPINGHILPKRKLVDVKQSILKI